LFNINQQNAPLLN